MEKQKDENGKPLTFWGGVNSSNTPEEQLLQEARKEAEKVYPTESYVNYARREGYIQGYIQQAEKRKSEAVKFLEWCLEGGWGTTKNGWILNNYTHNFKKSSELFDIFIQQQLKQQ